MKTERLYKLTKKGEELLKKLGQCNKNKHIQLAEKLLFSAIKPINKGKDNEIYR
jgi:hypothetical protein